ncbi:hypothetical protein KQX54_010429 [Cotesia glomerata]|uniref:Uncharacterized protein n=1 Tax=Cotesia glomerata TaxID=32391 RepID=A0AAV7I2Q2_COTGL|nr:hypothetical protein KQX54_010429 [Cotesia glomerata]
MPDNCKEFLLKSRQLVNCFLLANELLSESAIVDDQDIDESVQYDENTNIIQKELTLNQNSYTSNATSFRSHLVNHQPTMN